MAFTGLTDDRLAIHELVMSYGSAVTRADAEAWGDTWTENATWQIPHFPGLELTQGREKIVTNWLAAMQGFEQIVFFATLGSLTVDGETGQGITYTQEYCTDNNGVKSIAVGRYEDQFVKQNGRWYFQNRTFSQLDGR